MDIAILPGDGIGPEVVDGVGAVLEAVDAKHHLGLHLKRHAIGLASLESRESTLPGEVMEAARAADGLVMGPVSTYEYPSESQGGVNPSARLRTGLDLYANIRPAWTREGIPSVAKNMDVVVVRENTEGFYADRNMHAGTGEFMPTEDVALAVRKITAKGSRRIARVAFELARRRAGHVTAVHKANVLRMTDGLFLDQVRSVAEEFEDVRWDERIIDAMTAHLIRSPHSYDVILTTNMYGDILSDEAAELAGGLGLAGALNAGDHHAMAQATHGSAPDIAGRGIANPTALMRSAAMLLEWLGVRHGREDLQTAGREVTRTVDRVLAEPANRTPDLGGTATTQGFTESVIAALRER